MILCREFLVKRPTQWSLHLFEAEIEFDRIVDDSIIQQIENNLKQGDSRWRKRNDGNEYICSLVEPNLSSTPSKDEYWRIVLRRGSNLVEILYGRV